MCIKHAALLAMMSMTGCFGSQVPATSDDGGFGAAVDLAPTCIPNNDAQIDRGELQFPFGLSVHYLTNPAGTTVTVNPAGTLQPGGRQWDLTSTQGDVLSLVLEPVAGQWFAASFPNATYATLSDPASNTLGIFRVTDQALQILGFASRTPNQTLLVYDQPVESLRFPLREGDAWVTGAKVINGTLNGQPFA